MYELTKVMEISAAHHLVLSYASPCCKVHGHNWTITIRIRTECLNTDGMVLDFSTIKNVVNTFDHQDINTMIPQPTAENMAKFLVTTLGKIMDRRKLLDANVEDPYWRVTVTVEETKGNSVSYTDSSEGNDERE